MMYLSLQSSQNQPKAHFIYIPLNKFFSFPCLKVNLDKSWVYASKRVDIEAKLVTLEQPTGIKFTDRFEDFLEIYDKASTKLTTKKRMVLSEEG